MIPTGSNSAGANRTSVSNSGAPLRILRIADSPTYSRWNTSSGSLPCGETRPTPVTKTRRPRAAILSAGFCPDVIIHQRDGLTQSGEVDPLVRDVDPVVVREVEYELGDRERVEAELGKRHGRIDGFRLDVVFFD